MMMNYIVHLSLDESSKAYVQGCVLGSAKYTNKIFLLTRDNQLKDWAAKVENVEPLLITDDEYENAYSALDKIFYHDNVNPKSFDFNCFLRHILVCNHLGSEPADSIIFQDSDILLTCGQYFLDLLKSEVTRAGVATRSAQSVYFSAWSSRLYEQYASISSMKNYFEYCKENLVSRCSDMTYFKWWCAQRRITISPLFINSSVTAYDPFFSQFLFACSSKLWQITGDDRIFSSSNDFIKCFKSLVSDELNNFMNKTISQKDGPSIVLTSTLRDLILDTYSTALQLGFEEYSRKLIDFHSLTYGSGYLNAKSEIKNRRLAYVHLQGPAKEYSNLILEFFSAKS